MQLTVDSALCPVLKVLNPASELGTTETEVWELLTPSQ